MGIKVLNKLSETYSCEYPLIEEVSNLLSNPPESIKVIEEHGDFHFGNILINKDDKFLFIDPQLGINVVESPFVAMIYTWFFVFASPDYKYTNEVMNLIENFSRKLDCNYFLSLFIYPTMIRCLDNSLYI